MSDYARAKVDPPPAPAGGELAIKADKHQFEALATFARADFWCFVELMFDVLYPGQKLVYAGYLELIATAEASFPAPFSLAAASDGGGGRS